MDIYRTARNGHPLLPALGTGQQGHLTQGDFKGIGQETQQGRIGPAFHRWCGKSQLEGVPMTPRPLRDPGAGLHVEPQFENAGGRVETMGHVDFLSSPPQQRRYFPGFFAQACKWGSAEVGA